MDSQPESDFDCQFVGRQQLGHLLTQARSSASMTRDDVVNNSKTGFSRSSLQAWEAGEREPKLDNLYDLANLYGVHPWQLLSGESLSSSDNIEPQPDTFDDDYVYIPAYDIEVSAGHGSVCFTDAEPHKHLAFRQRWITARGLQADALAALFTRGDSMTPTIPEGAAVIIDQTRNQALDGKVYVIRIDDRHYVKRTQWLIGGGLRLISDNKLYDPLDITKADMAANNVQICGQVIHASYDLPD